MQTKRTAMQRAADADRITKRILRSLRREPVTVTEVCKEFKCSRTTLRQDLTIWLEARGADDEVDAQSILNWRDSHVASKEVRAAYVAAAEKMYNDSDSYLTLPEISEVLGVDSSALRVWLKDARVKLEPRPTDQHQRKHTGGTGDLDLTTALEQMRLQKIIDVRSRYADEIANAELV